MHVPVLLEEAVQALLTDPEGFYVDATCGTGGHSAGIAKRLNGRGRLLARDRDAESLEIARKNLAEFGERIIFEQGPFSTLERSLAQRGVKATGLLADLGISMYQMRAPGRGFSFTDSTSLDMRMDRSGGMTAEELINFGSELEIARILEIYGEERRARRIARAIVRARPVRDSRSLANIIQQAIPTMGRLHPGTKSFQGIRMAVNQEGEELESLLAVLPALMAPAGRAVFISFHSGDDRLIKRRLQELARAGQMRILTKHVVTPTLQEVNRNAAARSAKLRAAEWMEADDQRERA